MNDKTQSEQDTVTITLPARIKVTGVRGLTRELDMTKATPEKVADALDYWFGVLTQRASASIDGFDEKKEAEQKMADRAASWEWEAGRKGGGSRIDETEAATRRLLESMFKGAGLKAKEAKAKAKDGDKRWTEYFRLVMEQQLGKDNVTDELVNAEVEAQQATITDIIKAEVEAERERKAAKAKLAGQIHLTVKV